MAWRGRSFSTEGRIDVLSEFRYFLTRVVVYVGMCVWIRTHTRPLHRWPGYSMRAQVWDGHLGSRKNPDRLKSSIYVDRIDVHSTFVRQAGRRVEMPRGKEDGNIDINTSKM